MYRVVALSLFLCLNFQLLPAQKLTGIWRGYFIQKNYNPFSGQFVEDRYKYEVQINELPNKALEGVTYSYKTTVFYGKAEFRGLYTPSTKNLVIKETKMLEIKAGDLTVPCLMTCYLDYSKEGKMQTLSGTYSSMGEKDKSDCGSGMVYLEKVQESDFEPAPFLKQHPLVEKNKSEKLTETMPSADINIKKIQEALGVVADGKWGTASKATLLKKIPNAQPNPDFSNQQQVNALLIQIQKANAQKTQKTKTESVKPTPQPVTDSIENIKKVQHALGLVADGSWGPKSKTALLKKIPDTKPVPDFNKNEQINALIQQLHRTTPSTPTTQSNPNETKSVLKDTTKPIVSVMPHTVIPPELTERKNKMVREIFVSSPDVKIDFYDNGVIDNDTITVYDDHQLVVNSGRLSEKPITVYLHLSKENPTHEIITVANNLGDVPPNTALMVVTAGNERHEIFITSDEGVNAKVLITYRPKTIRAEKY
ncbi:MAG: hypothetical protein EKK39_06225 [Sphingobacteriales bacterium]|uniref:hypothetical protein n=1 Tax=Hydrotalea flava TaxID=714549 RepID=UPI00082C36DF|nr:hypothetical protein [Hydrotalea flava]RTL53415.1 MAG: hypothetical protein EKK39_06225 [Sphingobacteriales bacterium]